MPRSPRASLRPRARAPSSRASREGSLRSQSHSGAASPSTTAAVLAALASRHESAATDTVVQGPAAGAPVRGSRMWWQLAERGAPAPHRGARARETTGRERDTRRDLLGRGGVVVVDPDHPATARRLAGNRDVPADRDSTPPPVAAAAAFAIESAASAFAVAPRSSSTPAGTRTVPASSSISTSLHLPARSNRGRTSEPSRSRTRTKVRS